jgi:protein-disulfide isomerase
MTMLILQEVRCRICGQESEYPEINSTNTIFGAVDLDTRPPEFCDPPCSHGYSAVHLFACVADGYGNDRL